MKAFISFLSHGFLKNKGRVPELCYLLKHVRTIFTHESNKYIEIKKTAFKVNPSFGKLYVSGNIDYIVKPTNPQDYPNADHAFVTFLGLPSTNCSNISAEVTGISKENLSVFSSSDEFSPRMFCQVEIPIKYDIDAQLVGAARMKIKGMEADEVNVKTQLGELCTSGLKCHNMHVNTDQGPINIQGTMQGNLFITAKSTKIKAKRLQGLKMKIEAEELHTTIESSYMNEGLITAQSGQISIKNLHGCTDLLIRNGNLDITGLHGQISGFVDNGNINIHITEILADSVVHLNSGTLTISILEKPRQNLEVSAPILEVSEDVKSEVGASENIFTPSFTLSMGGPVFSIKTDETHSIIKATVVEGKAIVKRQDWFSTLGIKT